VGIASDCYNKLLESDLEHILVHTSDLWSNLKDSTIFVTGGTGFFGKWFLETFAYANQEKAANLRVIILSRDPDKFLKQYPHFGNNASFKFIKGDVRDFPYPDEPIHYVIHAATESSGKLNIEDPLLMFDTIVNGTLNVLNLAKQKNPKAFLFTSSGAVYGKQPPDITHVTEDYKGGPDTTNFRSAYSEGKRAAELLCSVFHERWHVGIKIARCFAFVGPYLPLGGHFAIGNFIGNALRDENITILGDGTQHRSYLYAADLVIWLYTILLKGVSNRPYNVGSDKDVSIHELAQHVNKVNSKVVVKVLGKSTTGALAERYVPSIDRARDELYLDCFVSLDNAIRQTFEFNMTTKN
jgi:dTDP-glucose 4,6-dehydratase